MADSRQVFSGKFACGVPYELREASAFSDRTELALFVEGSPVVIIASTKKRNNTVVIGVTATEKVTVKASPGPVATGAPAPSLDGLATGLR